MPKRMKTNRSSFWCSPPARPRPPSSKATSVEPARFFRLLLDFAAVISPVQQGLALPRPAVQIALRTVLAYRGGVPRDRAPTFDLTGVVAAAASHVISTVPLKPPARILRVNPAFAAPETKRLRRVDPEIIQRGIVPLRAEFSPCIPAGRKFAPAVGHVLPPEDAERKHLPRRQLGFEIRREVSAGELGPEVDVSALHPVVDDDALSARSSRLGSSTARRTPHEWRPEPRLFSQACRRRVRSSPTRRPSGSRRPLREP